MTRGVTRGWEYRFVDDHDIVHIEGKRGRTRKVPALSTACDYHVPFGMMWDDDVTMVVTCLHCLGAR